MAQNSLTLFAKHEMSKFNVSFTTWTHKSNSFILYSSLYSPPITLFLAFFVNNIGCEQEAITVKSSPLRKSLFQATFLLLQPSLLLKLSNVCQCSARDPRPAREACSACSKRPTHDTNKQVTRPCT